MIAALALLAALAPERAALLDEVFEAPAGGWRAVDVSLRQQPATLECRFAVVAGRSGVRVALLRREDVGRFRGGRPHRVLLATGFVRQGSFRYAAGPGDYSLLLDNRMEVRGPASVRLEVLLEFPRGAEAVARELSPSRRLTVIAVSLAVFAVLAGFAARRLWRLVNPDGRTPQ